MSNFPFVDDIELRENIDQTFIHIVYLLSLLFSSDYGGEEKDSQKIQLRKTIIIHTVSIIEALLCWKLDQVIKRDSLNINGDWDYKEWKKIYDLGDDKEIGSVVRSRKITKVGELNFNRLIDICYKYEIITTEKIKEDLNKVRKWRNSVHLYESSVENEKYSKKDLNFCFNVARRIKDRLSKIS